MARLILIADDSPIIQRKAQRILEDAGFEVQTVSNGVAAVKKLPALLPALVLADVCMPGKDGYEVCEFVKTSASLLHVPVLLVGSDLEPYDEQRGERVRADGIIKKPFTPEDLIAVVSRLMGPLDTPESPLGQADMIAAPTPLPETPVENNERLNLIPTGEPEAQAHPEAAPGGLTEPSLVPSTPSPEFFPEPSREVEESRSHEVEESAGREAGEPSPQEFEGLTLPPQLLDLTAPESLPEPATIIAEITPEPVTAIAPEAVSVGPEPIPEFEESRSQGAEESANREAGELSPLDFGGLGLPSQLLGLAVLESLPEPGPVITEGTPDQVSAIEHEPTPASPETSPGNEQSRSQEFEQSRSQEVQESISRGGEEPGTGALGELSSPRLEESEPQGVGKSISASQVSDCSTPPLHESPTPQPLNTSASHSPDSAVTFDPEWVYRIVHKVVTKMAPPILAPEQLEELACKLTDEIATELGAQPGSPDRSFSLDKRSPVG